MKIKQRVKKYVLKKTAVIPVLDDVENNKLLVGKVALITGGSGGIGMAIAKEFAKSGCKVVTAGTSKAKLERVAKEIGCGTKHVMLDIKEVSTFKNVVEEASGFYGDINILVNSAEVHLNNPVQDFFAFTESEYDDIMSINLKGTYFFSREVAKHMIDKGIKGHILNISSSTALEPAWSPYRLSKWGIRGLTQGLASVLQRYGIVVNAIGPGSTATSLLGHENGDSISTTDNQVGRYGIPEEIAQYAKMLVSDLGDMVVGDTLYISGGRGITEIR